MGLIFTLTRNWRRAAGQQRSSGMKFDHIEIKVHVDTFLAETFFVRFLCRNFSFYFVLVFWITINLHCVSKKRHPFYFCENLAKYYPISIIFGSTCSIPEEICNKSMHVCPPHLFTVLIPYLVKIMVHLSVFTLF